MKNIKNYINTIYQPAFLILCIGLTIFSLSLGIFAFNLRLEMLNEKSDIIYRYPQMLEKILFPIYILIPTAFVVDLNERQNKD